MITRSLVFGIGCLGALLNPTTCEAVVLRSHALVGGPYITLGDVFTDLAHPNDRQHLADEIIEPSPAPGKQQSYRAAWATNIAKRFGLTWQPQSPSETIVLERTAQELPLEHIKTMLRQALDDQRSEPLPTEASLVLDREPLTVLVPQKEAGWSLEVQDLRITDQRFHAKIVLLETGQPPQATVVSGQWIEMLDLPVLARAVKPGELIEPEDFLTKKIRRDRLRTNLILSPAEAIGKTPMHRVLAAGECLSRDEIRTPHVVHRDTIVTMVVETPHMHVSARGRALNDAAVGEEARVANLETKKVVSGIAVRPGVVSLSPMGV